LVYANGRGVPEWASPEIPDTEMKV
jgi:hypothetical protein